MGNINKKTERNQIQEEANDNTYTKEENTDGEEDSDTEYIKNKIEILESHIKEEPEAIDAQLIKIGLEVAQLS